MFKLVLLAAVVACALAAPAPYDNPPKTGVVQEISKYHVTADNKQQVPSRPVAHQPVAPLKPAVVPAPQPGPTKPIQGPTPVPIHAQPTPTVPLRPKREADHTSEHKLETNDKPQHAEVKLAKPEDFKRTTEELKPKSSLPLEKRESVPVKEQEKPQVNVKPTTTHSEEHKHEDCGSLCALKDHKHHKRGATGANPSVTDINAKIPVIPAVHVAKEATPDLKKTEEKPTTPKGLVKREDPTTEKAPEAITKAAHHLSPTSVHSSFSHTWTRPQAAAAVEAHKDDEKVPAASDNKPVIASIDPLKPFNDAKTSTTTTSTVAPPSTTSAAGRRIRRGVDETEEQDEPKEPKPTKAWWRSLDLNKKEQEQEVKNKPTEKAHVEEANKKSLVKPAVVPAAATLEKKDDKVTQKRETLEEKKPSVGTPLTSTLKPNRAGLEQSPQEYDNKAPQFVHPVPVSQILGQKQANLATVQQQKKESSEEEEQQQKKTAEEEKKQQDNHHIASPPSKLN